MKTVKIAIACAGFATAILITLFYGEDENVPPDTEASKTLWKCASCEKRFELTAAEYSDAFAKAGSIPIKCPSCSKIKGYQLMSCLNGCPTLFFGSEVPGETGQCPDCEPNAEVWNPVPDDDPEHEAPVIGIDHGPAKARPTSL